MLTKQHVIDFLHCFGFQGPIIGFTFGIVVKNPELWKLGVLNELIGLSICLSFGETLKRTFYTKYFDHYNALPLASITFKMRP